jgi:RNA polymerase sigma-70 factor (ECF subfamily)
VTENLSETICKNKTDNELVDLSLNNQQYFYCLIERYEKQILYYILRISSSNKEDAEDILQEVFLSVYENLNDFDQILKFSSWLYRIAHNKTISHWRRKESRPKTISTNDGENELFNILPSDENILLNLENQCTSDEIQEILFNLSAKYREVLILKFLEEKNYKEISDILKKPMGTIATLINRAKKQFQVEAQKLNIKFELK